MILAYKTIFWSNQWNFLQIEIFSKQILRSYDPVNWKLLLYTLLLDNFLFSNYLLHLDIRNKCSAFTYKLFFNTHFFYNQHFHKQHQAETGANNKQKLSNTLKLNSGSLAIICFFHPHYYPKLLGDILKSVQKTSTTVLIRLYD